MEASGQWEFPRCAVPLEDSAIALAAGYPDDDEDALAAWASRVANGVARAGYRRAVLAGSERLGCAALEDALSPRGGEGPHDGAARAAGIRAIVGSGSGAKLAPMRLVRSAAVWCGPIRAMRGLAVLSLLTGVGLACSTTSGDAVHIAIAPSIVFPQGVLDSADGARTSPSGRRHEERRRLRRRGCARHRRDVDDAEGGDAVARHHELHGRREVLRHADHHEVDRMCSSFFAQALDASNAVIANGCATATVNQDTLAVSITMQRFVPPATCGNGVIESTEQCDPPTPDGGSDLVCDAQCHSVEETLSTGATSPAGPAFFPVAVAVGDAGRAARVLHGRSGERRSTSLRCAS